MFSFSTSILILAAVLLAAASFPAHAGGFDMATCKPVTGERVFIYQNEESQKVLGCFRMDKDTCEVTFTSGENPPKLISAMTDSCRKSKSVST